MRNRNRSSETLRAGAAGQGPSKHDASQNLQSQRRGGAALTRRALFRRGAELGLAAGASGVALSGLTGCPMAPGDLPTLPTSGDVAVLKFLAAAELIETDLWDQYCQLATGNDAYREAIGDGAVLPRDPAEEERLRALATIERLLYEIRYELGNRPELVTVPLADLTALLEE